MTLTVFLSTFNRLETLRRTLDSYQKFTTPHEIVVVDNGSDHPRCLALLDEIEGQVSKVYRMGKVASTVELTVNFDRVMSDYHDRGLGGDWFAVTDADICFEGSSPETLGAYIQLAEETGYAVGCHTRIDAGLPAGYPLRSRVLACESRLYYRSSMNLVQGIPCSPWAIDTTFHLFPRTRTLRRLKMNTLRCGPPFDAMHLDWYLDVFNQTEENPIYIGSASEAGSWGSGWVRGFWKKFLADPDGVYAALLSIRKPLADLCNTSFMLAWCLQYGVCGAPKDTKASIRMLREAIPPLTPYWPFQEDWLRMIYQNDFSSLGWDE